MITFFRRKKKCIRYKEAEEQRDLENHGSDENLGSCGSIDDDAQTPDDDTESLNQSMSSPGGLSGLSSLQSPSTSLASPINLLASPSTPNPHTMSQHHHEMLHDGPMNGATASTITTSSASSSLVASLVNQLQRSKNQHVPWDGKLNHLTNHHHQHLQHANNKMLPSNGQMLLQDEIKKEQQQHQKANSSIGGGDITIKTEPMDQSQNNHHHHHQHNNNNNNNNILSMHHQQQLNHQQQLIQQRLDPFLYDKLPIIRNPVGANPRDINNPLSVNQLTKRDFPGAYSGAAYYSPFQKPFMTHPLAHPHAHHHSLAQFHAANFANIQLAAAAAAQQAPGGGGKDASSASNGTHHRNDDGNAISVT